MRFALMRRLDFLVGLPLLVVLALLRRLSYAIRGRNPEWRPGRAPLRDAREILIIKFLGFGSMILAGPAIAQLRRRLPEARLTVLTFQENAEIARVIAGVDQVLTVSTSGLLRFVVDTLATLWRLRRHRYSAVLNLEFFSNYAAVVAIAARAERRVAFGGLHPVRRFLFTDLVSYESHRHVVEKFGEFATVLTGEKLSDATLPRLAVPESARSTIRELLDAHAAGAQDHLVVVNVNCGDMSELREWPLEHFATVLRWLDRQDNMRVFLIGGRRDRERVAQVLEAAGHPGCAINVCGQLRLLETAALIEAVSLFVGNDSGPLHIAAAQGTPTISFFGPESAEVYGPRGEQHETFYLGIPCSPCLNVYTHKTTGCPSNVCLQRILPATVVAALERRLAEVTACGPS